MQLLCQLLSHHTGVGGVGGWTSEKSSPLCSIVHAVQRIDIEFTLMQKMMRRLLPKSPSRLCALREESLTHC